MLSYYFKESKIHIYIVYFITYYLLLFYKMIFFLIKTNRKLLVLSLLTNGRRSRRGHADCSLYSTRYDVPGIGCALCTTYVLSATSVYVLCAALNGCELSVCAGIILFIPHVLSIQSTMVRMCCCSLDGCVLSALCMHVCSLYIIWCARCCSPYCMYVCTQHAFCMYAWSVCTLYAICSVQYYNVCALGICTVVPVCTIGLYLLSVCMCALCMYVLYICMCSKGGCMCSMDVCALQYG